MDKIYLFLFTSFRFLIIYAPNVILYSILDFLSYILFSVNKKHRKIAKANLDLAYEDTISEDEKNEIIKGCYKNLVYTLADFIRNQGATKEEVLSKVTFKNESFLTKLIKDNRKIIIMTAHYGNWELLSLAIAAKLTPLSIVGRDLESDVMNKILTKNREQFDVELLSKTGAMKGMVQALKKNRPVGILVDQNTKNEEGILIDFFGKKARHTPSAAVLAKKFDAVIIPAFIKSIDNENYEIEFFESFEVSNSEDKEKDILECVQKQADITEQVIRSKPNEWFWLHQRWKNQYEHIYK